MIVYHGTTKENSNRIKKEGFCIHKCGTNWGNTYGKGIYFTKKIEDAQQYGDSIIICDIEYKPYVLNRDYRPNNRKDRLELYKIQKWLEKSNYTCIENIHQSEIIIYDTKYIHIEL